MQATKQLFAILMAVLLISPAVPAQEPQRNAAANSAITQDVLIIIQQQQVRFAAQKAVEEMRLEVFDQTGELVYDSGPLSASQINWSWQKVDGSPVKSGLYAYTLSIKEVGAQTARVRTRGCEAAATARCH